MTAEPKVMESTDLKLPVSFLYSEIFLIFQLIRKLRSEIGLHSQFHSLDMKEMVLKTANLQTVMASNVPAAPYIYYSCGLSGTWRSNLILVWGQSVHRLNYKSWVKMIILRVTFFTLHTDNSMVYFHFNSTTLSTSICHI